MAQALSPTHSALNEYIARGEDLIDRCHSRQDIHGTAKLARKIQAEVKFLRKLNKKDKRALEMHLKSTNLTHLEAIVQRMETLPGVTHVLKRFQPMKGEPVIVDIICNQGYTWVKVIARKAEALHRIWSGGGQFGDKNLVEQAAAYTQCTKLYMTNFTPPQLLFIFCQGISSAMKTALENNDVIVDALVCDLASDLYAQTKDSQNLSIELPIEASKPQERESAHFWASDVEFYDSGDSDSSEELLTASELLQRQKGRHDLMGYISKKEKKISDSLHFKMDGKGDKEASNCGGRAPVLTGTQSQSQDIHSQSDRFNVNIKPVVTTGVFSDSECERRNRISESASVKLTDESVLSFEFDYSNISSQEPVSQREQSSSVMDQERSPSNELSSNLENSQDDNCEIVQSSHLANAENVVTRSLVDAVKPQSADTIRERGDCVAIDAVSQSKLNSHLVESTNLSNLGLNMGALSYCESQFSKHTDINATEPGDLQTTRDKISCDQTQSQTTAMHFVSQPQIKKLNLDITTLISYISNLCHGHCHYNFKEPILTEQAAQERRCPLLPVLDQCFQGKDLFICETALTNFRSILSTVGGPNECRRAELLLAKITVIPNDVSARIAALPTSAKIKERAKVIFGTAESFEAITVTANSGFVRAAEHKGICIPVVLHESRALTEKKQAFATPI